MFSVCSVCLVPDEDGGLFAACAVPQSDGVFGGVASLTVSDQEGGVDGGRLCTHSACVCQVFIISLLPGNFGRWFSDDGQLQAHSGSLLGDVAHVGQLPQVTAGVNCRGQNRV